MIRPALLLAIAVLALGHQPLSADSAGGTMVISATVLPSCSVEADPMAFGTLAGDRPHASAQAAVRLACTPGTPYAVTMDGGQNGGRRMAEQQGAAFLSYEIFQDAAGSRRWGDGAAEGVGGVAPANGAVSLTAHGRILSRSAAPGRYGDVVTVTVQF